MLYEELKTINTKQLLVKLGDYASSASKFIDEKDYKMAQKVLEDLRFFADYHLYVNMKTTDEYDSTSLEFIETWDKKNSIK